MHGSNPPLYLIITHALALPTYHHQPKLPVRLSIPKRHDLALSFLSI